MVAAKAAAVPQEKWREIEEDARELAEVQNAEQDVSILPTLHVTDIARDISRHDVMVTPLIQDPTLIQEGSALWSVNAPCNGITYIRVRAPLPALPSELVPWLPLYCYLATRVGDGDRDYRQLSQVGGGGGWRGMCVYSCVCVCVCVCVSVFVRACLHTCMTHLLQHLKLTTGGARIGTDLVFSTHAFGSAQVELHASSHSFTRHVTHTHTLPPPSPTSPSPYLPLIALPPMQCTRSSACCAARASMIVRA